MAGSLQTYGTAAVTGRSGGDAMHGVGADPLAEAHRGAYHTRAHVRQEEPRLEQNAIWEYYQTEGIESFAGSATRLHFLARKFAAHDKVLDIGIGAGFFEELAIRHDVDVYCLDPSERAIQSLRDRLGMSAEAAVVGSSQRIPFPDGFFDGVVMSEVLEHLAESVLAQTLKEVGRVLRVGGRFLGTVPTRETLEQNLVVCPNCECRFHRWGHVQRFDSERVRLLLEDRFEIDQLRERLFVDWKRLNWKGRTGLLLKRILLCLGIHGSHETLYFSGIKRPT